jgi:WD40 repeat protein
VAARAYHWRHGWVPLDHAAAKKKYGSADAAERHGFAPVAQSHLPRDKHVLVGHNADTGNFSIWDTKTGGKTGLTTGQADKLQASGAVIKSIGKDGQINVVAPKKAAPQKVTPMPGYEVMGGPTGYLEGPAGAIVPVSAGPDKGRFGAVPSKGAPLKGTFATQADADKALRDHANAEPRPLPGYKAVAGGYFKGPDGTIIPIAGGLNKGQFRAQGPDGVLLKPTFKTQADADKALKARAAQAEVTPAGYIEHGGITKGPKGIIVKTPDGFAAIPKEASLKKNLDGTAQAPAMGVYETKAQAAKALDSHLVPPPGYEGVTPYSVSGPDGTIVATNEKPPRYLAGTPGGFTGDAGTFSTPQEAAKALKDLANQPAPEAPKGYQAPGGAFGKGVFAGPDGTITPILLGPDKGKYTANNLTNQRVGVYSTPQEAAKALESANPGLKPPFERDSAGRPVFPEDWDSQQVIAQYNRMLNQSDNLAAVVGSPGVAKYTGNGFTRINGALRGTTEPSKNTRTDIRSIDKAFKDGGFTLPEDRVFRRGGWSDRGYQAGNVAVEASYLSTTISPHVSGGFGDWTFDITVPKGVRVLTPNNPFEGEVMLPRNSAFKITEVSPQNKHVKMTLLPGGGGGAVV